MGETVFHYNPLLGRPHSEADQYFRRAAELAPDNVDYLIHQLDSAVDDWEFGRVDSLNARLMELSDREDIAEYSEHMTGMVNRLRGDSSWTISDPGSMNTHFVRSLAVEAATHLEDLYAAEDVARLMMSDRYPSEDKGRAGLITSAINAGQGRLKESLGLLAQGGPIYRGYSMIWRSLLLGVPIYPVSEEALQSVRSELVAWDTAAYPASGMDGINVHEGDYEEIKAYLDALLGLRLGDLEAVTRQRSFLASRADSSSADNLPYSLLRSIDAVRLLEAGNYAQAIDAMEDARLRVHWRDASKSPFFEQGTNRFVEAEALRASGRLEEAIRVYRSITAGDHLGGVPFIGPQYLGVADAYEQLGQADKAIEFYGRFVRMWKDCDPELVPIREEARRNLERLVEESVREPT
jgi:tetratricopeptide (TPR) repeat protein